MDSIWIRNARPEDAQAIAEVHFHSSNELYLSLFGSNPTQSLTIESRKRYWANRIPHPLAPNPATSIWVAEEAQFGVIGFLSVDVIVDDESIREANLNSIYLYSEFCNRGLGRALFNKAVEWLIDQKIENLFVWVLEKNPACLFYEKLGGQKHESLNHLKIGNESTNEVSYDWSIPLQKYVHEFDFVGPLHPTRPKSTRRFW